MATFYCINLDFRSDRWQQVQEEARRSGIVVKRVAAQDGTTAEFKARFDRGEFSTKFRNAREVAICFSHIAAIKAALADNQSDDQPSSNKANEFIYIIEDDVLLVNDFSRRLTEAIKAAPKKATMLYLGYLRYHFTAVKTQISGPPPKWLKMTPVYGTHAYAIRRSAATAFLDFLAKCDRSLDDYITANHSDYVVASQPLAYQRLESASDITGWDFVVNPFNRQVVNPLKLRYLWPSVWPRPADHNAKILHILPGQRLYFDLPEGWTTKVWQYFDEIYDYKRYGKVVPFHLWAVYYHGGLAFPDELSHWLDKHYAERTAKIRDDVVSARPGDPDLLKIIKARIWAFEVNSEGGRWGKPLSDKEVAPDFVE